MKSSYHSPVDWPALVAIACALSGCSDPPTLGERCVSQYPPLRTGEVADDTTSIPASHMLPVYHSSDSLPQIYSPDSATGWYRNLFYADFEAFPNELKGVHSFIRRFDARVVGRAEETDWHAVMIPDPGADTARFNLLLNCIGANFGVYVRPAYSRPW